jgi:UPF0755 protein
LTRLGKISGILFSLVLLSAIGIYAYYHLPYDDQARRIRVVVAERATLDQTARLLDEKGLLRFPVLFTSLAQFLGQDRSIRAGEYSLHTSMSPNEVLQRLCRGAVVLHKITVPEGYTVRQIAGILAGKGFASREEILRTSRDVDFVRTLGFEGESLEGYLFPETYLFAMGLSPQEILKAMARRFGTVYSPEMRARQDELGWRLREVVTMASIVEKETACKEEKPLIASVLVNRLRRDMPLQCDPTVIYGLEDFDGNLRKEHLRSPNPYNTYLNKGLPPGAICNPGLDSLRAALYFEDTSYLYFVSKSDGTHHFSSRLEDHAQAVEFYQKKGGKSAGASRRNAAPVPTR